MLAAAAALAASLAPTSARAESPPLRPCNVERLTPVSSTNSAGSQRPLRLPANFPSFAIVSRWQPLPEMRLLDVSAAPPAAAPLRVEPRPGEAPDAAGDRRLYALLPSVAVKGAGGDAQVRPGLLAGHSYRLEFERSCSYDRKVVESAEVARFEFDVTPAAPLPAKAGTIVTADVSPLTSYSGGKERKAYLVAVDLTLASEMLPWLDAYTSELVVDATESFAAVTRDEVMRDDLTPAERAGGTFRLEKHVRCRAEAPAPGGPERHTVRFFAGPAGFDAPLVASNVLELDLDCAYAPAPAPEPPRTYVPAGRADDDDGCAAARPGRRAGAAFGLPSALVAAAALVARRRRRRAR